MSLAHIPRKRFGQHFLCDSHIIAQIVRSIDPRPDQVVIEIGPGLGALTFPLLDCNPQLSVIEIDRDLAATWRKRQESGTSIAVIESDVLRVDFSKLSQDKGQKLRVVGNLPYNISTPILFHLLDHQAVIVDQHFMLQKEVVDRMIARPGSKDYGRLSVMLQWRYEMESILDVPPESFDPPPRVDSAIVRMTPKPHVPAFDRRILEQIVSSAFSQRRKILRNTLGAWLKDKGVDVDFDVQRRAEEVEVEEYLRLAIRVGQQLTPSLQPTQTDPA